MLKWILILGAMKMKATVLDIDENCHNETSLDQSQVLNVVSSLEINHV